MLTKFTVIELDNGGWTVIPDPEAERVATDLDVKRACTEVLETLHLKDIARVFGRVVTESQRSEQEKTTEVVRESLRARGLM